MLSSKFLSKPAQRFQTKISDTPSSQTDNSFNVVVLNIINFNSSNCSGSEKTTSPNFWSIQSAEYASSSLVVYFVCALPGLDKTLRIKQNLRNKPTWKFRLKVLSIHFLESFVPWKDKGISSSLLFCVHTSSQQSVRDAKTVHSIIFRKALNKKPGFCSFFSCPCLEMDSRRTEFIGGTKELLTCGIFNNEIQWHTLPSAGIHSRHDLMRKFSHDGQRRFFVHLTA